MPERNSSMPPGGGRFPSWPPGKTMIDGEQAILAYLDARFTEPADAGEQRAKHVGTEHAGPRGIVEPIRPDRPRNCASTQDGRT